MGVPASAQARALSWSQSEPWTMWPTRCPWSVYPKPAFQVQLDAFAQVVQEEAGEDQVAVEVGIELAESVAEAQEGVGVLEQAAEVGVVQGQGGRSALERGHELVVCKVLAEQGGEWGVLDCVEDGGEPSVHLADVVFGGWEQVQEVFFGRGGGCDLLDDELDLALVGLGLAVDVDEAVGGERSEQFLGGVPHAPRDPPGAVGDEALEVGLAVFGLAELAVLYGVDAFEPLAGLEVADVGARGHRWGVPRRFVPGGGHDSGRDIGERGVGAAVWLKCVVGAVGLPMMGG